MLEFLLCSLVTILPDYLFRRYFQGKRWGNEITFQSMWFELRWGIVACFVLTVALITLIFYYHPSTKNVTNYFRTVSVLPESPGRVAEIFVANLDYVEEGQPLFRLDDREQRTALATSESQIVELSAQSEQVLAELAASEGLVQQAESAVQQARDELRVNREITTRNENVISDREIERLELALTSRQGALATARANRDAAAVRANNVLPAQLATARAKLAQAQVALDQTIIYAGVSGELRQFALKAGDIVNPLLRPAGILVPRVGSGVGTVFQAGFDQVSAQVIKPGMLAEITCISNPFTIVPMVVTDVSSVIAAGQFRPSDQLVDALDRPRPGTNTVLLEPLYEGGADGIKPGSKCIANGYTSNHDAIASGELSSGRSLFLHMVDTVGVVHAVILRIQALLLPVQLLVFAGH